MIKAIVFDFGGVLLDWNPRYVFKDVFLEIDKMDWFLNNVCSADWNLQQDKGRTFEEGISLLQNQFPDYQKEIAIFRSKWSDMLKGEIAGTVSVLKELKKFHNIFGLTNWSAETFPIVRERFEFINDFDAVIVSGEEGLVKPDENIYKLLLRRYKLKANNCIFIDDNEGNIEMAKKLGFVAILFKNAEGLRIDLKKLGIQGFA